MSAETEWVLADLASFRPEGCSVLFVRPREPMSDESFMQLVESVSRVPRIPGVLTITVPHGLELIALTEGDLEKIGYVRIPTRTAP